LSVQLFGQSAQTKYPRMAPLDQYLMERGAEIALARSAAPASIAESAEIFVLTSTGFEPAAKGTNGFVCIVQRSWSASIDDPDFWNPKLRAPICFNAAAAKSQIPMTIRRTNLVLAGKTKEQVFSGLEETKKGAQLSEPDPGAMCYMMSKQGYLSDRDGHWHPHLMFFIPLTEPATWGAGLSGSPVFGFKNAQEGITVFLVPVSVWSDGSPDSTREH